MQSSSATTSPAPNLFNFSDRTMALIGLHFTVFLWGLTAILGKLISYGSFNLVWHRMFLTFFVYTMFPAFWRNVGSISWKQFFTLFLVGIIVSIHWLSFYGSIKIGDSASIPLACLGSISFFSSIFEPIICKTPFSKEDLGLGLVVIGGVMFIYFSLPHKTTSESNPQLSVIVGMLAAVLGSLFTVLNKKFINDTPLICLATIEMGAGAFILSIIVPIMYGKDTLWYPSFNPYELTLSNLTSGPWDLIWLVILSVLCTNVTFYLSNVSLVHLSAFESNLIYNLEPIYGIILGGIIFHENKQLGSLFYVGTAIIILALSIRPVIDQVRNLFFSISSEATIYERVESQMDDESGIVMSTMHKVSEESKYCITNEDDEEYEGDEESVNFNDSDYDKHERNEK